jgi:prepilin-type N-terminal cleavage/methylation domain-containing protein
MNTKEQVHGGFSLVELSIVLVILGLLIGGILSGQALIRAAELRAVTTEYNTYVTTTQTFRDKYFALPGDMTNATQFWNAEPLANCPGTNATPSTTTATCNGRGIGQVTWNETAGSGYGASSHRYWQHLANAGLIEGRYTGVYGAGGCNGNGSCTTDLGINAPKSRISNAGWSVAYMGTVGSGHPYYFAGNYENAFYVGATITGSWTYAPMMKAEEAWNIDTKIDDGRPGLGRVKTWHNTFHPNCASTDVPATAVYQLANTNVGCSFIINMLP